MIVKDCIMKYRIIFMAAACLMLSGCGLYKKYEKTVEDPANPFGESQSIKEHTGNTSIAQMSWREFFPDAPLQELIELALVNNTDLAAARINVEKSQASLKASRLAYFPSLYFTPQGSLSKFGNNDLSKSYNLQIQLSWDIDVFGSITNKKRAAQAALLQSQMYEEATRSNLISTLAQQYFKLQLLDRELEILIETDSLWKASLETQQALYENGQAYSTAVSQQEASWLDVKLQIVSIKRSIHATENDICSLLCISPQRIKRTHWGADSYHSDVEGKHMFDAKYLSIGIPATMLEKRPDIRLANYVIEEAYYNTQTARAAFFPSLSLSGTLGWTNSGGGIVSNPGQLLLNLVGQLSQPLFNRGAIKANYKTAQLTEEHSRKLYVQTVIDAGNEVNEALADCQAARDKHAYYHRQVQVLHEAYTGTHELMDNGKASYLEVLTAQESLLNAQLNEAENIYNGAQAVIALYIALGGGAE